MVVNNDRNIAETYMHNKRINHRSGLRPALDGATRQKMVCSLALTVTPFFYHAAPPVMRALAAIEVSK
ncbi:MAG: hypothetical protein CMK90_06575 [Pseudomonadales bacterium]|nr:hypothetical protein [Pseudomonadales bacterium]|tara:strand:+ start:2182 stop:2385 length:204 start_codon:yes stop_codon:yes gene_type:complete